MSNADTITIPASYIGTPDAELSVDYDGMRDCYRMTLTHADGHVIADAAGFNPPDGVDFGPHRPGMTAGTFGAFLAGALEDSSGEAREGWATIADDASDWTDALSMMEEEESERGKCQRCGTPLEANGRCHDLTCPFSDFAQTDPRGWEGHPESPYAR